jgi:hypothetical protein
MQRSPRNTLRYIRDRRSNENPLEFPGGGNSFGSMNSNRAGVDAGEQPRFRIASMAPSCGSSATWRCGSGRAGRRNLPRSDHHAMRLADERPTTAWAIGLSDHDWSLAEGLKFTTIQCESVTTGDASVRLPFYRTVRTVTLVAIYAIAGPRPDFGARQHTRLGSETTPNAVKRTDRRCGTTKIGRPIRSSHNEAGRLSRQTRFPCICGRNSGRSRP